MAGTVCVACKVPNGLILQLFEMADTTEVTPTGHREIKKARLKGEQVKIAGYSRELMKEARAPIANGFALTRGVDADFWEEWLNQNRDADYVRNGLIFAHAQTADTRAHAKELRDVVDNQGPIVPDTDRRLPQRRNRAGKLVAAIQTEGTAADED